jgi:hypothetical protein
MQYFFLLFLVYFIAACSSLEIPAENENCIDDGSGVLQCANYVNYTER